jgi:MFS transporter, SP family, xylose:H+ symportor
MDEIKSSISHHKSAKLMSFGKKVIWIGILLSVFQQFVGINVACITRRESSKAWVRQRMPR